MEKKKINRLDLWQTREAIKTAASHGDKTSAYVRALKFRIKKLEGCNTCEGCSGVGGATCWEYCPAHETIRGIISHGVRTK
jgi:hypothetical protein